jgi:hypothetical protein
MFSRDSACCLQVELLDCGPLDVYNGHTVTSIEQVCLFLWSRLNSQFFVLLLVSLRVCPPKLPHSLYGCDHNYVRLNKLCREIFVRHIGIRIIIIIIKLATTRQALDLQRLRKTVRNFDTRIVITKEFCSFSTRLNDFQRNIKSNTAQVFWRFSAHQIV